MTTSAVLVQEIYLPTPVPMLQVVTRKAFQLGKHLLTWQQQAVLEGQSDDAEQARAQAHRRELELSANFLELFFVTAGVMEALHSFGIKTQEELDEQAHQVLDECARITGLAPSAVLRRHQRPRHLQDDTKDSLLPVDDLLKHMMAVARTVMAACPISMLEQWGHELSEAELSHRCRKAYDGLAAFLRRHSPEFNERLRTVGRAYAEGRLSLKDVSQILQMPPSQTVALLEKYSFYRSLDTITLASSHRSERLRAIAEDARTSSTERGTPSEALLDRDVIASQRIEGVDAHPWLATNGA